MLTRPSGRTSVVLADDHEIVRQGLRAVLEQEEGFEVVAECTTSEEAIEVVERSRPDILLLDLRMPGVGGVEVCRTVCERCPETRVVVLSAFDSPSDVAAVMNAGAAGYLLKDVHAGGLVTALRSAADGETVLHPEVARKLFRCPEEDIPAMVEPLSGRELEVLRLMGRGLKNDEIATELWLSMSTVKTHVGRIIAKLGQRDRTEAVLRGISLGLITVDAPDSPESLYGGPSHPSIPV